MSTARRPAGWRSAPCSATARWRPRSARCAPPSAMPAAPNAGAMSTRTARRAPRPAATARKRVARWRRDGAADRGGGGSGQVAVEALVLDLGIDLVVEVGHVLGADLRD